MENSVANLNSQSFFSQIQPSAGTNEVIYPITNEIHQLHTIQELSQLALSGNTMIGVSGMCTLNFASLDRKVSKNAPNGLEHILILDRSTKTETLWVELCEIIKKSKGKEEACESIISHLADRYEYYYESDDPELYASLEDQVGEDIERLNPVCYLIQPLSLRKIVRCNEDSAGHSFSYGQAV
ncbi:hypothetical protein SCG7109_AD_00450 [Chlamydiales bacterium SCGC AG-110-M15]|nr:hypothetical protein SCG7109_AD_00450 [Chlamydiales bacterium SCGC AG-110-M15]